MSLGSLGNILKIFGGSEPTEEEREALIQEALLMTLARATIADTNVKEIEVTRVRDMIQRRTGEIVSDKDVRMAAHSELFEKAPLDKYLARVGRTVEIDARLMIVESLAEVIKADERISPLERDYFDMVCNALQLKASDLFGLAEYVDD